MAAPKRTDPLAHERDIEYMLKLKVQKVPFGKILEKLNARRRQEAYDGAIAAGWPASQAEALAAEAGITSQTAHRDFRKVRQRLMRSTETLERHLIAERLDELESHRVTLVMAEARAWEQLEESGRKEPSAGKTPPRSEDPRWMAMVLDLVWKQVVLGREIFQLRVLLGQQAPWQLVELAKAGEQSAVEQLRAHDVAALYSMNAEAAGLDPTAVKTRLALVSGYLEKKVGAGSSPGAAAEERVVFEVTGMEIDD